MIRLSQTVMAACMLGVLALVAAPAVANTPVTIQGAHFVRAGKPHQIVSGSMDFQRIPRAYWKDRLQKARAMGLNAITTYVYWNAVEPRPGQFDFSGDNDVAAFVQMAQHEGIARLHDQSPDHIGYSSVCSIG